jgi:DNA-binding response OmpR family regulator
MAQGSPPPPAAPSVLSALGIGAEPIHVPPLVALAAAAGHVVPRENLYRVLWGQTMPSRRREVDVYVAEVRGKLADAAPDWVFIHTHQKFGYRLSPEKRA